MCIVTSPACSCEDLDEAAHVGALAWAARPTRQAELAHGLLLRMLAVEHDDRIADAADPDLVERDPRECPAATARPRASRLVSLVDAARGAGLADDHPRQAAVVPSRRSQIQRARFSLVGFSSPSTSLR